MLPPTYGMRAAVTQRVRLAALPSGVHLPLPRRRNALAYLARRAC